jgi:hypothetical protein
MAAATANETTTPMKAVSRYVVSHGVVGYIPRG